VSQVRPLPLAEHAVVQWLLLHDGLAALVADHIYTDPGGETYPYVRVTRVGGGAQDHHWLDKAVIQLDAFATSADSFGSPRIAAATICGQAVAALHDLLEQAVPNPIAAIANVRDLTGPRRLPDPDARLVRFTADVEVTLHPLPLGS